VIHEAGHSIANLMDEYDAGLPDIDWPQDWVLPPVLPWVNVDTDPLHPKWEVWLTPGVPLPTPTDAASVAVGAFEGAAYAKSGIYRPQANCCMRKNGQPFCAVCTEAWIASIYQRSRLADGFLPRYSEPDPPLWYRSTQEIKFKA
jgi:IgA Peptidase M64